ncbi:hypothetical protein NQ317_001258 [Molorchus minor]|uniref:C2H2-type domain-containing protein n=1 Tax=Molorchus minor TaxID=1323400 RepID=A0ABQ9IVW5_9CUCU|nr:hypothetical protein NQ317_001258 [Molorchus minor]
MPGQSVNNTEEQTNGDILRPINNKSKKEKKNKRDVDIDVESIDINHNCVTCKASFSSKNKLFDHLKKTGHGVYISSNHLATL